MLTARRPAGVQAPGPAKARIIDLMRGFTAETTPAAAAKIPEYRAHLAAGTTVYVTYLPGADFGETLSVSARLRGEGFEPVPHLAARSLPSERFLDEQLARLAGEAGVTHVLVIGGATTRPVGPFSDSMQVLETGLLDRHGIRRIGIAGHPEGSPDIPDHAAVAAIDWKNAFAERTGAALYIVTQFCFEAAPIIAWDRRLRATGNRLPIRIGIPGPATIKSLLAYARACGIGPSMAFLSRQARNIHKLLTISTPDRLVTAVAGYRATDPGCGIEGIHIYPLGGLGKAASWCRAVAGGRFTMNPHGDGFTIDRGIPPLPGHEADRSPHDDPFRLDSPGVRE